MAKNAAKTASYIGTLNAIATGERGGHEIFEAWGGTTKDKKLKPVLDMVAIREMEHSWAFEKRLCELGHEVRPAKQAPELKKLIRLMKSKASDSDKFAAFGIGVEGNKNAVDEQSDGLLKLLADKTIDPQTGALLGRFICEERDSGAQLIAAYRSMNRRTAARKRARASKKGAKKK